MDLGSLGVNVSVLIAIVGIAEYVKNQLDTKNRFKKYYVVLPLILSVIAAIFITEPLQWQSYLQNVFIYAGISAYGYDFIVKKLKNAKKKAE
jgi:hypothetical protein